MKKYILVEVYERDITVYQYSNLRYAQQDLCNRFNEIFKHNDLTDGDDCYLSADKMYAWANAGNANYDWIIKDIN